MNRAQFSKHEILTMRALINSQLRCLRSMYNLTRFGHMGSQELADAVKNATATIAELQTALIAEEYTEDTEAQK